MTRQASPEKANSRFSLFMPIMGGIRKVLLFPIFVFIAVFHLVHSTSHCIAPGFNHQICLLKVSNNQEKLFLTASDSNWARETFVKVCFTRQHALFVVLLLFHAHALTDILLSPSLVIYDAHIPLCETGSAWESQALFVTVISHCMNFSSITDLFQIYYLLQNSTFVCTLAVHPFNSAPYGLSLCHYGYQTTTCADMNFVVKLMSQLKNFAIAVRCSKLSSRV